MLKEKHHNETCFKITSIEFPGKTKLTRISNTYSLHRTHLLFKSVKIVVYWKNKTGRSKKFKQTTKLLVQQTMITNLNKYSFYSRF